MSLPHIKYRQFGFTFVEFVVTVSIITVVSVMAFNTISKTQPKNTVTNFAEKLKTQIDTARSKSIAVSANKGGEAQRWGVYMESGNSILPGQGEVKISPYKAIDSCSGNLELNENEVKVIQIPQNTTVTTSLPNKGSQSFILFQKLSGEPQICAVNRVNSKYQLKDPNYDLDSKDLCIYIKGSKWMHVLRINAAGTTTIEQIEENTDNPICD